MGDYLYTLAERDVLQLIRNTDKATLSRTRDEIAHRVDHMDLSIDVDFMNSVLERLNDLLQGVEPRPGQSSTAHQVKPISTTASASMSKDERLLEEEKRRGLSEGEEVFESTGRDFLTPEQSKYRPPPVSFQPRIPLFYNKLKKGIVWNKYAQTHYDENNPPPKQLVGYKFNIFYPDLQDPSKAPKYKIEAGASVDHLLLRFSAGPPYEDLVFKIINKEWDTDRKYGFVSQFEKGVLQLHFNLKKDRYRR